MSKALELASKLNIFSKFEIYEGSDVRQSDIAVIEAFYAAAKAEGAKEEREECAKVCETTESYSYPGSITKQECARNIRARGEA